MPEARKTIGGKKSGGAPLFTDRYRAMSKVWRGQSIDLADVQATSLITVNHQSMGVSRRTGGHPQ